MNKEEFEKMKVGDKVKLVVMNIKDYPSYMKDWINNVVTVKSRLLNNYVILTKKGTSCEIAAPYQILKRVEDDRPTIVEHLIRDNKVIIKLSNGKVGVAACAPEDEFDICEGLKLAIDRAYGKVPGFKKQSKVREVERVAKVGEYIKIVRPMQTEGRYKKNDVLKVIRLCTHDGDVRTECDGLGNVGYVGYNYINRAEYVVLENYKPKKK